jgi:hypothetical protein
MLKHINTTVLTKKGLVGYDGGYLTAHLDELSGSTSKITMNLDHDGARIGIDLPKLVSVLGVDHIQSLLATIFTYFDDDQKAVLNAAPPSSAEFASYFPLGWTIRTSTPITDLNWRLPHGGDTYLDVNHYVQAGNNPVHTVFADVEHYNGFLVVTESTVPPATLGLPANVPISIVWAAYRSTLGLRSDGNAILKTNTFLMPGARTFEVDMRTAASAQTITYGARSAGDRLFLEINPYYPNKVNCHVSGVAGTASTTYYTLTLPEAASAYRRNYITSVGTKFEIYSSSSGIVSLNVNSSLGAYSGPTLEMPLYGRNYNEVFTPAPATTIWGYKNTVGSIMNRCLVPVVPGSTAYSHQAAPANSFWDMISRRYFTTTGGNLTVVYS